ncbi:diacylglycerol kinase family protein, partial [Aphanothece microscopica]|uniref:diacylglycerol kinase family protein n=1 Tax=Aphanothece microscopica TaxID=1049561 RepID=UPI003985114B
MSLLIDLKKAVRSFRYAGRGILDLFRFENNARIHLLVAVVVVIAGFYFQLSTTEWALIIVQIALVWTAEAF